MLRDFEARLAQGGEAPLSQRTLLALRVAIYTGVRHRSELLWTRLEWCRLDDASAADRNSPRQGGPGEPGRRPVDLSHPDVVRCLKAIYRPPGSEHLTVPGDKVGQPLYRLNEAWEVVLRTAGLAQVPVKAQRHGFSTHSVGIIASEHRAQLRGHQGRPMTDTVYLHRHGPDLAQAAALVENHLRSLLGDVKKEPSRVLPFVLHTA